MDKDYDFSGWATKSDLKCSDGRTIMKHAFKDCDGKVVPLVWNHDHASPENVLGHALLEDREDGVYTYGYFNDNPIASYAKSCLRHGDIDGLSIYANQLKQDSTKNVMHGMIREVSLVLAGANPGAYIEEVVCHSDGSVDEATIGTGEPLYLPGEEPIQHSDDKNTEEGPKMPEGTAKAGGKTVGDVLDSMTEEQREVVNYLVGMAAQGGAGDEPEGDDVKHNVFEGDTDDTSMMHAAEGVILGDAKRFGSVKESFLAHSVEYGIENIDYLFPEYQNLDSTPQFISREMGWVKPFLSKVHHSPMSRIKSMFADITEDEARAKGYIKGKKKKEEVFTLLKRTTSPTTVYKKQKFDRDDVIDITDFDVVAWVKTEMRTMLDEEIARAILVGDGRLTSSDDHINENNIRPIWKDNDLFTIQAVLKDATGAIVNNSATEANTAKAFIRTAIKSRKDYKGSGNPILYTTEDWLTSMLLLEDNDGRPLYDTEEKLRTKLRVSEIVTVEVMEGLSREISGTTYDLLGIIVNPVDYNVGADKGGSVNMFDDFDIDYNQMKYLIETRCSGALIKPYSAIVIERPRAAASGSTTQGA